MILTNITIISRRKVIRMDLILQFQMVREYAMRKLRLKFDAKLT